MYYFYNEFIVQRMSLLYKKRIEDLDLLRGFAILGVLFRHSDYTYWYTRPGWAGVDLFFVLSGFLVSRLLFSEYLNNNKVNIKRFLIRRGFKIYPTFYIFLIISLLTNYLFFHKNFQFVQILSEICFLQSYLPGCFLHTWSLAIEEQFYFFLSFLILALAFWGWIKRRILIIILLMVSIIAVIVLRITYINSFSPNNSVHIFKTHLRMDGLLLGTLIAYCSSFYPNFKLIVLNNKNTLLVISVLLISLIFLISPGSYFMNSIGVNIIHLGFGILVLLASNGILIPKCIIGSFTKSGATLISQIGIYSYSIYVWHLYVRELYEKFFINSSVGIFYIIIAIIIGILLSIIIEQQMLKYRDKWFA